MHVDPSPDIWPHDVVNAAGRMQVVDLHHYHSRVSARPLVCANIS